MADLQNTPWSDADLKLLHSLRTQDPPVPYGQCALRLGRTYGAVRTAWYLLRKDAEKTGEEPEVVAVPDAPVMTIAQRRQAVLEANALNPPIDTRVADRGRIHELEQENARLRQQLTWAQHAESTSRTGGVLTLRASDHHYGDANHLLSCGRCLHEKFLVLVEQYLPDRIQIIAGDDWVAGRGIYREQDLDMVTCDVNEQLQVGAVKAFDFLTKLRTITKAPVRWYVMRGNHDYANNVSMSETLFLTLKNLCAPLENVDFKLSWDCVTANLADVGTYNVLVRHGFGHSNTSPNSPSFINAVKDEIIVKQRQMLPNEQYRRVLSGHTHWLSVDLERIVGLPFDTTGGLQRNARIKLGSNQRPVGFLAYVSPKGMDSDILQPIPITPDKEVYLREIEDPHLPASNREDAAQCIRRYSDILTERGDFNDRASFGVPNTGGRW